MTEDSAREMGRLRHSQLYAQQAAQQAQQATQQQAVAQQRQSVHAAVSNWEAQARSSDPDFDKKAAAMNRIATAMIAEKGLPPNEQVALEMVKAAYDEVNTWFQPPAPAKRASRPDPSSAAASRPVASKSHDSLAQAIGHALEAGAMGS